MGIQCTPMKLVEIQAEAYCDFETSVVNFPISRHGGNKLFHFVTLVCCTFVTKAFELLFEREWKFSRYCNFYFKHNIPSIQKEITVLFYLYFLSAPYFGMIPPMVFKRRAFVNK